MSRKIQKTDISRMYNLIFETVFIATLVLLLAAFKFFPAVPSTELVEGIQISSGELAKNVQMLALPSHSYGKIMKNEPEPDSFFTVDDPPEPIGGISAIRNKIVYPETARKSGLQGKVYVNAFVNESGEVVKVKILKGLGSGLDEAALNAILATKFKPGKQKDKPVKAQVTIPILFRLK